MTGIKIPFKVEPDWFGFVTVETTSKIERDDGTVHPDHRDKVLESAIQALETHREANARWTIPETEERDDE